MRTEAVLASGLVSSSAQVFGPRFPAALFNDTIEIFATLLNIIASEINTSIKDFKSSVLLFLQSSSCNEVVICILKITSGTADD